MEKKTKKKWNKLRHKIIVAIVLPFFHLHTKIKYHFSPTKFKEGKKRQYLILLNHQTGFDQFFVCISFGRHVSFIASEDIFSNGFISKLLRFAVGPIPIKKQQSDLSAVRNAIQAVKEGSSIAVAPEGNRTYSGKTEYMKDSITGLAKILKLPIAFYKIEGGYGVLPRWADKTRKGKMKSYVSKVLEYEDFKNMSNDELFELIKKELYVDETKIEGSYEGKNLAEHLERVAYVCSSCGLAPFETKGNFITCKKCGKKIEYLPNKTLKGVGFDFPFKFYNDWYNYQTEFIKNLDLSTLTKAPVFEDTAKIFSVTLYKSKKIIDKKAKLYLFGDRIEVETKKSAYNFVFSDISGVSVLGRNKLNVYHKDGIFQFKGEKSFNAVKYVNFYYRSKYKEAKDVEFLGL